MTTVNIFEAKSSLSRLITAVETGREAEIVIARNGRPVARLVPIAGATDPSRRLGLLAGRFPPMTLADFDADNDRIASIFHGETE